MQRIADESDDAVIQIDVSLQAYNTLAVPAKAAYFTRCTTQKQLLSGLKFAKDKALPILVLGEGSNTVFSSDFDGLLILNRLTGIELLNDNSDSVTVEVAAGENWHEFVLYALEQRWYGLENLALIPGLVGAAPIQNIGAYGVEVKDTIEAVQIWDPELCRSRTLASSKCGFEYRDSVFKHAPLRKAIITSVIFRLSKTPASNLSYPALADRFDHVPSPIEVCQAVCEIRSAKLPMPEDIPNAGSFFKNPVVDQDKYSELKAKFPSLAAFPLEGGGAKIAAAWLIEQCGWKDKSVEGVYVHRQHALVVVNPNFKLGSSILTLAASIQADVKVKYDLILEIEPRIY